MLYHRDMLTTTSTQSPSLSFGSLAAAFADPIRHLGQNLKLFLVGLDRELAFDMASE